MENRSFLSGIDIDQGRDAEIACFILNAKIYYLKNKMLS